LVELPEPLAIACDRVALVDAELLASPPYEVTIECVPAPSADVEHCDVRIFPLPESETPAQPPIDTPPSVKFMVPVGATPLTVCRERHNGANTRRIRTRGETGRCCRSANGLKKRGARGTGIGSIAGIRRDDSVRAR
jgi:hypothetical protein